MTVGTAPVHSPNSGHESDPERWELCLYVAGQTPKSLRAIDNLQRICDEELPGRYHIEIIDLVENPQLARDAQIIALPTLVRQMPQPLRKILGDLSDTARVLLGLQVVSSS